MRRPGVGRILLVDPDPESRSSMMRIIAAAGYEVVPVTDAGQTLAVYVAADPRPDIVVAPAFPPGLSGAALAERLRAVDPALPLVLLSPYEPGAVQAPPGVTILSHPFDAEDLLLAIADGLSGAGV